MVDCAAIEAAVVEDATMVGVVERQDAIFQSNSFSTNINQGRIFSCIYLIQEN